MTGLAVIRFEDEVVVLPAEDIARLLTRWVLDRLKQLNLTVQEWEAINGLKGDERWQYLKEHYGIDPFAVDTLRN